MTLASNGLANAIPFRWTYADATARGAATGFVTADLYSLALQLDNATVWILTATTPTWVAAAGAAGLSDPTTTKGDLLVRGASAVGRHAVGSDGQVFTADSAQADGVKWATPMHVLISEQILGADGTVTFSSIPGTYRHLLLRMVARTDRASFPWDSMLLRFNGDTAANYDRQEWFGDVSTHQVQTFGATSLIVGYPNAATATAGQAGAIEATIWDYARTTWRKMMMSRTARVDTTTNIDSESNSGGWRNTAAITSISLFPGNGTNFKAGSIFSLYGLN